MVLKGFWAMFKQFVQVFSGLGYTAPTSQVLLAFSGSRGRLVFVFLAIVYISTSSIGLLLGSKKRSNRRFLVFGACYLFFFRETDYHY